MAIKRFVDANILLRCILRDDVLRVQQAERDLAESEDGSLILTAVIIAEVIYIMRRNGYARHPTAEAIGAMLNMPCFYTEHKEAVVKAVALYGRRGLDFADCYILERSVDEQASLLTQDKKLHNARQGRV